MQEPTNIEQTNTLSGEQQGRVDNIVEQAKRHGVYNKKKKTNQRKSVLPGHRPESYVEKKMREKKEAKDNKEIQALIDETLDCKAPISNAKMYISDAQELTARVVELSANQGIKDSLEKLDVLANSGDDAAKELSKRVNVSILAFKSDLDNSIAMSKDLTGKIELLEPIIEKVGKNIDGQTLRIAAELDAVTSAANWSMVSMFGVSAQSLMSNLNETLNFTNGRPNPDTDPTVITDVNPK